MVVVQGWYLQRSTCKQLQLFSTDFHSLQYYSCVYIYNAPAHTCMNEGWCKGTYLLGELLEMFTENMYMVIGNILKAARIQGAARLLFW